MKRSTSWFLTAFTLFAAATAFAQPGKSAAPISTENAKQLDAVRTIDKQADSLSRGPRPGQWLIESRNYQPPVSFTAEILDGETFKTVTRPAPDFKPIGIVFSSDGKRIAFRERSSTQYVISDFDGKDAVKIEIGKSPSSAAFSPDGKHLAVGYVYWEPKVEGAGHSEVRLFDIKGNRIRTFGTNGAGGVRPVFSPDGKLLAAANRNHETQIFDVETGKLLQTLGKRMTQESAFSPDGKTLAEGYVNGTVGTWNVETGKLIHSRASGCREIYSVDWSPSGDLLATAGRDGKAIVWNPRNLDKLKELDAGFWVIRIRFSADGTQLLTSSASNHTATEDRKITVWAAPNAK